MLLCGAISLLKRHSGRLPPRSGRRVPGRLAVSAVDWNSDLAFSGEEEHASSDQQVMAAALEGTNHMGRYTMALASHEPSFAPGAPASLCEPGGATHMDA